LDYIASFKPDILGVQEAYVNPIWLLSKRLKLSWYGRGRNDGLHGGEHSAILFNSTKFAPLDTGTFWISKTPKIPSKFGEEKNYRVTSWLLLKDLRTKVKFYVYCTHWGLTPGFEQFAGNLHLKVFNRTSPWIPIIFMGDTNMVRYLPWYSIITTRLDDSSEKCRTLKNSSDCQLPDTHRQIDFIFGSSSINVWGYRVPDDVRPSNGRRYSDHNPVVVDVNL
jgi:endonuclease/exonuclease/phosphatase family metal-dependent hydrolase